MVRLDGVENFRRVEGVFGGRLYRAGHLHAATPADRATLRGIGFALIVDLRRPAERRAAPSPDLGIATLASDLEGEAISPHLGFLRAGDLRPEAIEAYLLGYYQAAPFAAHALPLHAALIDALAHGAGPVLVHCTAGKDRTGLAIAIAQLAAGAARESVLAEYLRSNADLADSCFRQRAAGRIKAISGIDPGDALIDAFAGVCSHHLEAALDAIEWADGIDAYLARLTTLAGRI